MHRVRGEAPAEPRARDNAFKLDLDHGRSPVCIAHTAQQRQHPFQESSLEDDRRQDQDRSFSASQAGIPIADNRRID